MKINEIFTHLQLGELKQMGTGAVTPDKYVELVQHLNLGMLQLYTKFPLSEKEFLLTTTGVQLYDIPTSVDIAWTGTSDDVLRIDGVFDGDGCEVPLNDEYNDLSVYTPSRNTIQVPWDRGGDVLAFIYRAKPEPVGVPEVPPRLTGSEDFSAFLDTEVDLPYVLLEPLLAYITYRVHRGKGGEAGIAEASVAKQHFETMCLELETRNVLNNAQNSTSIRPIMNGWV